MTAQRLDCCSVIDPSKESLIRPGAFFEEIPEYTYLDHAIDFLKLQKTGMSSIYDSTSQFLELIADICGRCCD